MRGRDAARAAAAAISFLTILPVGRLVALERHDVARGSVVFPIVGAGIGAITGSVGLILAHHVNANVAAAVVVAVGAVLTGVLHLDALADWADGFGGRTRADALRIMRDPHLGAFGATALVLNLLIKTAAIASLVTHSTMLGSLIAAGALSRATATPLAAALPYAQPEPGTGQALSGIATIKGAGVAVAMGVIIAAAALRRDAVWPIAVAATVTIIAGTLSRHRLGGITGDVMGATSELCETLVLVAAATAI